MRSGFGGAEFEEFFGEGEVEIEGSLRGGGVVVEVYLAGEVIEGLIVPFPQSI